jgi:hypothetical protein
VDLVVAIASVTLILRSTFSQMVGGECERLTNSLETNTSAEW